MTGSPRRKRARKYISLRERLAAALSLLLPQEQRDDLRARQVPAKTVIALFEPDHNVLHALGGKDRWWNLTPLLKAPHREKSRRDTSIVAKVRRLKPEQKEFLRRVLAKPCGKKRERTGNWPKGRKLGHRPLRSGNNFKRTSTPTTTEGERPCIDRVMS
jgi:hypothetical protein